MYKLLIKPFLFLFYPERSHKFALTLFSIALKLPLVSYFLKRAYSTEKYNKPMKAFGLDFPNPIGLAAGFDKDGKHIGILSKLGFGFIEIGTVTPKPQAGNPTPRLFRLPKDKALINRMGFNNDGVDAMVARLKDEPLDHLIIGGNIGKNKITPNEEAHRDYLICFEKLHPWVDYFVVNVSSPNTPGLRDLQQVDKLKTILEPLVNHELQNNIKRPILLKIAPDMPMAQMSDIISLMDELNMDGIIASNTTVDRSALRTSKEKIERIGNGGMSGEALFKSSTEFLRNVKKECPSSLGIIGVGGIHDAETAKEKLSSGADLIQIYTGFIYEGPTIIKSILRGLEKT